MPDTTYDSSPMKELQRPGLLDAIELLEQVKHEMHGQSAREGYFVELGELINQQNEPLWNKDGISLKRRLQAQEITEEEVAAAEAELNQYFFPAVPGAAMRCIDGSTGAGYQDDDPRHFAKELGPQIQGGTGGEAVARRMAAGVPEGRPALTLIDDIAETARKSPGAFTAGGHTDDKYDGQKTGCGQIDGQIRKLPRYNDPAAAEVLQGLSAAVLGFAGAEAPEGGFERLRKSAASLMAMEGYLSAPEDVLVAIRSANQDGLETVIRPHNEITLTINFVRNRTFHRDHYNARSSSRIQNFNLDVWAILDGHDEMTAYALLVDSVATFMDLTDGSIRVKIRLPRENPESDTAAA